MQKQGEQSLTFYSMIENPKGLRVSLLEASKETIVLIAKQREIFELRDSKKRKLTELNSLMKEIGDTTRRLDELLPEKVLKKEPFTDIPKFPKTARLRSKGKIHKIKDIEPPLKPLPEGNITDLDRLDYTLKKIEEKIANLQN